MTRSFWTSLVLGLAALSGSALVGCDSAETTPPPTTTTPPATTPAPPKDAMKDMPKEPVKDAAKEPGK